MRRDGKGRTLLRCRMGWRWCVGTWTNVAMATRRDEDMGRGRMEGPAEAVVVDAKKEETKEEARDRKRKEQKARTGAVASRWLRTPKVPLVDQVASRAPKEGPFSILHACRASQMRVRVMTRHGRGIRGVCTGVVVAFDKHLNLLLRDVEEDYTVRLRHPDATHTRPRLEHRRRTLEQAMLFGHAIVSVSLPSGGMDEIHTNPR